MFGSQIEQKDVLVVEVASSAPLTAAYLVRQSDRDQTENAYENIMFETNCILCSVAEAVLLREKVAVNKKS